MKTRRLWLVGAGALVAGVLGVALTATALAAPVWQADGPSTPSLDAMHAACQAGDSEGMAQAMGSLTDEDWEAMRAHMNDGHHAAMGAGMMGSGMMSGGMMGGGMMGMDGMMGSHPGRSMMGW